jgi:hypothetical protein
MTTTRRLSARQLATKLAPIDAELAQLQTRLDLFDQIAATYPGAVPDRITDEWNRTSDYRDGLQLIRNEIAENRGPSKLDPIRAALVAANID